MLFCMNENRTILSQTSLMNLQSPTGTDKRSGAPTSTHTRTLSIEQMPVRLLLFYLIFYYFRSLPSLPSPSPDFFFICSVEFSQLCLSGVSV